MFDPIAAALPDVATVRRRSQSLAMLDAILSPEWEFRYYSFNCRWGAGEQMASMRNGQGDWYFVLFSTAGVVIKGFDHESSIAATYSGDIQVTPDMFDGIPLQLAPILDEPAFFVNEATYCIWRETDSPRWAHGSATATDPAADGSLDQLQLLMGGPADYVGWARDYYEAPVSTAAVERVYRHEPLTQELVHSLNPELDLEALRPDVEEIGYPSQPPAPR